MRGPALREATPIDNYGSIAGEPIPQAGGSRFPPQPRPVDSGNSSSHECQETIAPSGIRPLVANCHRATNNLRARAAIIRRRFRPCPSMVLA